MLRLQRVLPKWPQTSRFVRAPGISYLQAHVNAVKTSGTAKAAYSPVRVIEISPARAQNVLKYWKSAALAVGAVGLLDEQRPVACAANKGSDEDLFEQVKKMVQELSTLAMAQLTSLLPENCSSLQQKVDEFLTSGKGGQISGAFCMGTCAGFTLKKVSKLGAVTVGTFFILLQCASYSGYVSVDYKKLKWDFKEYLDIDQDAVVDIKDLDSMFKSVMKGLDFSLPAGSGFAAGLILGFRLG